MFLACSYIYKHSTAVEGDPRYSPLEKFRGRGRARAQRDGEFAKSSMISHIKTSLSYPNVSKKRGITAKFTKSFYQSYQNDSVMRHSDTSISKCLKEGRHRC